MTPFADPDIDSLMDQYLDADEDPQYLYPGSQTEITKKLRDWVPRRIESNKLVMAAREKSHADSYALLALRGKPKPNLHQLLTESKRHADYSHVSTPCRR